MADHIDALGIDVQKQFVYATPTSGPLHVPIANYPGGGVTWGYHVAPLVNVDDGGGGGPTPTVMDPSLGAGPLTVDQWVGRQTASPGDVVTATTDIDVYYRNSDGSYVDPSDPDDTSADLDNYRNERAALPASSGRNIPNAPVHFQEGAACPKHTSAWWPSSGTRARASRWGSSSTVQVCEDLDLHRIRSHPGGSAPAPGDP